MSQSDRVWAKAGWALLWCVAIASPTFAQPAGQTAPAGQTPAAQTGVQPTGATPVVVATVDGHPITDREVDRALTDALRGRPVVPEAMVQLRAETLERLIDRRLIVNYLEANKLSASPEEIELTVDRIKAELEKRAASWRDFLRKNNVDDTQFRQQLSWQVGWEKYLSKFVNDETLYAFYKANRPHYDGTEVRVSHILLRPSGRTDKGEIDALKAKAESIRKRIESGELTFAEAAEKYSLGPSRRNGGDLGLIPRRGVMVEEFAKAAFSLEKGKVSEPVITPFGIHLIYATDVKLGERAWTDIKGQLAQPLAQEMFEKVASGQREKAKIEFTGAMAHYKPGTKELVPATM